VDSRIINLWLFLQKCSPKDIKSLPILKVGEDIRNIKSLCLEQRMLLGFYAQAGAAHPGNRVSEMGSRNMVTMKKNLLNNIPKIKDWKIINCDYKDISNQEATWFIDPPYQFGGHSYKFSNNKIDYAALFSWCSSRRGQTIVCENTKATWLPVTPLKRIQGAANTNTFEGVYLSEQTLTDENNLLWLL
jgi:hypothetical protein